MAETTTETEAAPEAPKLDEFTAARQAEGFAIEGLYPANLRLRAEALSIAGKTEDPDKIIGADMIASTGERLAAEAREAAAREKAEETAEAKEAKRLRAMDLKALHALAVAEAVPVESDANKTTIVKAIEDARATRNSSEG
jgi:hypothetical protein